jgi:hypothetical protein
MLASVRLLSPKPAYGVPHGRTTKALALSSSPKLAVHLWMLWHGFFSKAIPSSTLSKYMLIHIPRLFQAKPITDHRFPHGHHIHFEQHIHVVDSRARFPLRCIQRPRMARLTRIIWIWRVVLFVLYVLLSSLYKGLQLQFTKHTIYHVMRLTELKIRSTTSP